MGSQNRTRYHQPMNEAAPGPFDLHHGHFYKLLTVADIDFLALSVHGGSYSLVPANRYYTSFIDVKARCRIDKIGIKPHANVISGNFLLGVHASDVNLLPDARVCQTASQAVGVLVASDWGWHVPTTTPIIGPGRYWVGIVCDQAYVTATSGMQMTVTLNLQSGNNTNWSDGIAGIYNQDVGAFAVPDPMTEVLESNRQMLQVGLKVTVL